MDCKFCSKSMGTHICGDEGYSRRDYDVYVCTRKPGHKGQHVACGKEHNVARWRNDSLRTEKSE